MRSITLVFLGLIFAARYTYCENQFLLPPGPGPFNSFRDNPTYPLGSQIDLQWETEAEAVDLYLRQTVPNNEEPWSRFFLNQTSSSVSWIVSYSGFSQNFDPNLSHVYYIQMVNHSDITTSNTTAIASCHYFNITDPLSSTSSASATPTSATPTSKTLHPASTPAISSPDPSSSPSPTPKDKSLSEGAVAGIAVSSALLTLIAASIIGCISWKRLQKKKKAAVEYVEARQDVGRLVEGQWKHGMPAPSQQRYEADGSGNALYEMPDAAVENARHASSGIQNSVP
ncbi:hypothetical protein LZ30DRAFT_734715 [Colletotrichum cereale]|nr:hypothetical protein LZ30DRAFT_734715 [Colletotrichum cereale]